MFKRKGWLRKLCVSLGISRDVGTLTIEGLAVLPLLYKKKYPNNIKLGWFLSTHWWQFVRYTPKDRVGVINSMNNEWRKLHPPQTRSLFDKITGKRGTSQSRAVAIRHVLPTYGKKFWLSIGVDNYTNFSTLSCAVNDATNLSNFAKNNIGFDQVRTALDVNREEVAHIIKHDMFHAVGPDDLVVITFHGHGVTLKVRDTDHGFLATKDSKEDSPATMISMKDLANWTTYLRCRHVLLILDCCFSGITAIRGSPQWSEMYSAKAISTHLQRSSRSVINAGNSEQQTDDGGWDGNSILTGVIMSYPHYGTTAGSVSALFAYVNRVVSKHCSQTPTMGKLIGDRGGDIFLAL